MDECIARECLLRRAAGQPGMACDETYCTFWRQLGATGAEPQRTCAIQYFDMLGGEGVEVALLLPALKGANDQAYGDWEATEHPAD
jgi:hypothetical protein